MKTTIAIIVLTLALNTFAAAKHTAKHSVAKKPTITKTHEKTNCD